MILYCTIFTDRYQCYYIITRDLRKWIFLLLCYRTGCSIVVVYALWERVVRVRFSAPRRGYRIAVIISVFQTDDGGSTPPTRLKINGFGVTPEPFIFKRSLQSAILSHCVLEGLSCFELWHIHRRYLQLFTRSGIYSLASGTLGDLKRPKTRKAN